MDSFAREFQDLISLIDSSESTRDRLEQTGVLRPDKARDLGIVGVGGRASGVDLDVRRDHPYAAYPRYSFRVPVYQAGDVWHRMQVRIDEVNESIGIIRNATEESLQRRVPCARAAHPVGPLRAERSRGMARRNHPLDSYRP